MSPDDLDRFGPGDGDRDDARPDLSPEDHEPYRGPYVGHTVTPNPWVPADGVYPPSPF